MLAAMRTRNATCFERFWIVLFMEAIIVLCVRFAFDRPLEVISLSLRVMFLKME
jgi:hypothetical protein